MEYQQSVKTTVYCSLDFKYFPFDNHTCDLTFGDSTSTIAKLKVIKSEISKSTFHESAFTPIGKVGGHSALGLILMKFQTPSTKPT